MEGKILPVSRQMRQALKFVRYRCIQHRDIKLEHWMINTETGHVKLIGFDFATHINERHEDGSDPREIPICVSTELARSFLNIKNGLSPLLLRNATDI